MQTTLNAYVNFKDQTRQAMEFYQSVFGGELHLTTFKDYHASQIPGDDDKIMHAELNDGKGLVLMAADTPSHMSYTHPTGFSLMLGGTDEKELAGLFNRIAVGGTVETPLARSPWGDMFGSCTDAFGIHWMVNIYSNRS